MSQIVSENLHLLQTLVDKRLILTLRQELAKNLPIDAFTALREILYNVAVGNIDNLPPEITNKLSLNRNTVFKIVDQNDTLSEIQRRKFVGTKKVVKFLEKILPAILSRVAENCSC